jgi:hypothetical protein
LSLKKTELSTMSNNINCTDNLKKKTCILKVKLSLCLTN